MLKVRSKASGVTLEFNLCTVCEGVANNNDELSCEGCGNLDDSFIVLCRGLISRM